MSEAPNIGIALDPEKTGFPAWFNGLDRTLGRLAVDAAHPYNAAFASALRGRLRDAKYQQLLAFMYRSRPEITPDEAMRTIRTATQASLMDDPEFNYPSEAYRAPVAWYQAHYRMDNPRRSWHFQGRDEARTAEFNFNHFRRLSTTISQRSVTNKFLGLVLSHRLGLQPVILDIGCGDNSSNRRLLLNGQFPYEPPAVVRWLPDMSPLVLPERSDLLAGVLAAPYAPSRIVGADIIDPTLEENMRWVRACPTPDEIASGEWASEHDALMRADIAPEQLNFIPANFAVARDVSRVLLALGGPVGWVSSSVSWYQGPAKERRAKFGNALRCVRPGGLATWQEFALLNPRKSNYMAPMRRWTAMNVFGYDTTTDQLHHLLKWSDGRNHAVEVQPALAQLAMGGPYEQEVRALAAV